MSALVVAATLTAPAVSRPAGSIGAKRAQVAALQAQLDAVAQRVEVAAEAYNGAVYRLDQVNVRIKSNTALLKEATADLGTARGTLSRRLVSIYRRGQPTLPQIVVSSGSITGALNQVQLLNRLSTQDAAIVGQIQTLKARTVTAGVQLKTDRGLAKKALVARSRERARVVGLMRQRQSVLLSARADLRNAIAAEAARVRRQAERARAQAIASQASNAPSGGAAETYSGPLPSGAGNAEAARIALTFQGVPYVWGGATPSGFDCSGLASYAYAKIGKSVPHYTNAIYAAFPHVPYDQLQPGDMVFFHGLGHMGIYIGNGQMVHAPHTGDVVRVASMSDRAGSYVGAVRP